MISLRRISQPFIGSFKLFPFRTYTTPSDLILGVHNKGGGLSTSEAKQISNQLNDSDLVVNAKWELGKVRLSYQNKETFRRVALVGLGDKEKIEKKEKAKYHQNNEIKIEEQFITSGNVENWSFEKADKVRESVKNAVNVLRNDDSKNTHHVVLDSNLAGPQYEQQAVEGAVLGTYKYKLQDSALYDDNEDQLISIRSLNTESESFKRGKIYAQAQILAATLAESPSNLMTPTIFSHVMRQHFQELKSDKIKVDIHDSEWATKLEMNSFLTVAKGSDEEPKVLEVTYTGNSSSDAIDLILVGKGITFDSGGISIKPGAGMKEMKGDMGGAATIMSALYAIARLELPLNVTAISFLCENMPSGRAVKPGDVIRAMNKKSIEIDNTDAEGRLILADALTYASEKRPRIIIDCATLTGAIVVALGNVASGVYTNSNELWKLIDEAGQKTNDYMWRMPLLKDAYLKQLKSRVAKLNNVGGKEGGSCTAATFLSEFVDFDKVSHWGHIDIAGTSMTKHGMTGRPTRALIELAVKLSEKSNI